MEENIGCKLNDLSFDDDFMDKTLKTQAEKEKIRLVELYKNEKLQSKGNNQ